MEFVDVENTLGSFACKLSIKIPKHSISLQQTKSCYIQYTLNDYEKEGLEKGVPVLADIALYKKVKANHL